MYQSQTLKQGSRRGGSARGGALKETVWRRVPVDPSLIMFWSLLLKTGKKSPLTIKGLLGNLARIKTSRFWRLNKRGFHRV